MKLILKYCAKAVRLFPAQFLTSMLVIALMTVVDAILPWGIRVYVSQVTQGNNFRIFLLGLLVFAVYYGLSILVKIAWYVALDRFGGKFISHLTLEMQEKMANTPYSEIEKIQPNIVRNILFTDVLNVFRVVGHHLPSLLNAIAIIFVALILASATDLKITALIAAAAAIGLLLSWVSRNVLAKSAGATNAKIKIHDGWCTHFVQMLPVIQTHNILPYFQQHSEENISQFIETSIYEDKRTIFWSDLINSYHGLFSIALSALLAMPLVQNSIADLVFYTTISSLVMTQAQEAELLFQQIIKSHVSFRHIDELNHLPGKEGAQSANEITSISFEHVEYVYANGLHALRDISCDFHSGDVIHLQGQNGSGKSTFIKLLTGLYQSSAGELRFNGVPSSQFSQSSRNRAIVYIGQDEQCLNENFKTYLEVMYGKELSDQVYHDLMAYVDLPDDGRKIQENGLSLSAGQRKKLLFAQMLLRSESASVIIMDELTAGMDAQTVEKVNAYIEKAAGNKILLLVDHAMEGCIPVTKTLTFRDGCLERTK